MEGPREETVDGRVCGEPAMSVTQSLDYSSWITKETQTLEGPIQAEGKRWIYPVSPSHLTSASYQCLLLARLTWKPLSQFLGQPCSMESTTVEGPEKNMGSNRTRTSLRGRQNGGSRSSCVGRWV